MRTMTIVELQTKHLMPCISNTFWCRCSDTHIEGDKECCSELAALCNSCHWSLNVNSSFRLLIIWSFSECAW